MDRSEGRALAYIVSANLNRRNLTKGQQAMALAMIYPEPARGRGKTDDAKKHAETSSFSYRRSNEDKRRGIDILLNDPQWSRWNDSEIARQVGVHHSTVAERRKAILLIPQD